MTKPNFEHSRSDSSKKNARTPSCVFPWENIQFDSDFLTRVTANVQEIFIFCTDDPSGVQNSPLQYEDVV